MSLSNSLSIISILVTVFGFAFVYGQIKEAKKQREQSKREVKISNAINIANRFEILIENEIDLVIDVLDDTDYKKVIDSIPDTDFKTFDTIEWETLCKNHNGLNKYKDYLDNSVALNEYIGTIAEVYMSDRNISPQAFYTLNFLTSCKWKLTDEETKSLANHTKDNETTYKNALYKNMQISFYQNLLGDLWSSTITNLLNKLESIAMEFNTGLADDTVVYQSLHQLFISTIKTLYPRICECNIGNDIANKYYTNIIELYEKWSNRNSKDNIDDTNRRSVKVKTKY